MVTSYEQRLSQWTPEAAMLREFRRKMAGPLNALMQRQIIVRLKSNHHSPLHREKQKGREREGEGEWQSLKPHSNSAKK